MSADVIILEAVQDTQTINRMPYIGASVNDLE